MPCNPACSRFEFRVEIVAFDEFPDDGVRDRDRRIHDDLEALHAQTLEKFRLLGGRLVEADETQAQVAGERTDGRGRRRRVKPVPLLQPAPVACDPAREGLRLDAVGVVERGIRNPVLVQQRPRAVRHRAETRRGQHARQRRIAAHESFPHEPGLLPREPAARGAAGRTVRLELPLQQFIPGDDVWRAPGPTPERHAGRVVTCAQLVGKPARRRHDGDTGGQFVGKSAVDHVQGASIIHVRRQGSPAAGSSDEPDARKNRELFF